MADSKLDSILTEMEKSDLSSDAATLRRALRDKVQFPHRRMADILYRLPCPVTETSFGRCSGTHVPENICGW